MNLHTSRILFQKDSGCKCQCTRAVYIEISLISWNLLTGPKHLGSIVRNMVSSEGGSATCRSFHASMDKIKADIHQITKKWNWKWIFIHQGYFFRKIPAVNASAPKYVHLQDWSLKIRHNIKMFRPKYWNIMQEQTQVNKT